LFTISLNNIGKKFGSEWIFRNLSFEIEANDKLVVLGGNGSGKSTLLQIISGFVSANEGEVIFNQKSIGTNQQPTFNNAGLISFASPYLQLVEDFTLQEMIDHTRLFKPFVNDLSTPEIINTIELQQAKNKYIKQFSSGMKQRLKLGLAILANTPLLLLDEPISNLDKNAIEWYQKLISTHSNNRTIIVCSNAIKDEYVFCTKELNVLEYKLKTK
jgi:ABC-type multidrug transport system ATPase subunit